MKQDYFSVHFLYHAAIKLFYKLVGGGFLVALTQLVFASALPPAAAQTGSEPFVLAWSSSESDLTRSLAWGDYDGDGDLDLAVGNGDISTDQPSRLYRNDGGMLTAGAVWSTVEADATSDLAWGDYDGDGDLDLAVGNGEDSKSRPNRLYRNDNGNLTVSAVWASNETDSTASLAWGDYDGDGDLDLAVGNGISLGQPNRLYRNDGGALSTSAVWSSTEADRTSSVAWGDYDGDGDLDLAAGNWGQPNRLYRNDDGTLMMSAVWSAVITDNTRSVAWGDYDSDGDLDLAVGNGDLTTGQPNRLYRNDDGALTTSPIWSSTEADSSRSVVWGDYDGDGDLDLAVGNRLQPSRLYRNDNGALTASAVWSAAIADNTRSVAWGDYDSDGDLDLAVANQEQPNRLYRNDTVALLPSAVWASTESDNTQSLAWGDYDGDGNLDLAVGNRDQPNRLYHNDSGALTPSAVWSSIEADSTRSVAWGDYDGDGNLDLAAGNFGLNRLYHNSNGLLTTQAVWSSNEADPTFGVAWGDYDNDSDLDLAVGNFNQPNRLYHNSGQSLITSAIWSSSGVETSNYVAWGDYDGDGDLDLAVGNGGQPNRLYRNDNTLLTGSPVWSSAEIDNTNSLAWGDYDGDGDLDLVAGNRFQPNRLYRNVNGMLTTNAVWSSTEADDTRSVAWSDFDGDGDIDLAAGNWGGPNRLYINDNGELTASATWSSTEADKTTSVAWGDFDGDGDVDLAAGNFGQPNRLYRNIHRSPVLLTNNPAYVSISRPGNVKDAFFHSSSQVIQTANISISYKLFDPDGDSVQRIFPEYSANGGGQWAPASPGPGGDGLVNLTASATGAPHTFIWHAEADLIKSDDVVFRIRAQPGYTHSPILWPAQDGKSPPFRVSVPLYVKVVDGQGNPLAGANIYSNGQLLGATGQGGLFNPGPLANGTPLIALTQVAQQATPREGHTGWAYRTYLTNLSWHTNGQPQPFIINGVGEQRLIVNHPLVLFNLLVSVEWDANDDYLNQIARAVQAASDYLYDLTDGQMAFGQVAIYDNGSFWADADLQISTTNIVHPHASIGGITSPDKSHVIRLGRFWDGDSGNQGPWDQPEGFRTLAHEFGHYGLFLYDEYFAYTFDDNGNLTGEVPAFCTGPENRNPANDATNASVMDYQYTSSEFSARDVSGLWAALCQQTAQWQLNGESTWETIARKYADPQNPPRWQFTTPLNRGAVLAGPASVPPLLPDWPQIQINQTGPSAPPRQLNVYGPQGPYWGAIIALYKQDGRVIGQGFTNSNGRLDVYGALQGDVIRAASFDGGLAGSVTVGTAPSLNLTLNPLSGPSVQAENDIPHLRVVAEPSSNPNQVDLLLSLQNFGAGADPNILVTQPGSEIGFAPSLSYSASTNTYHGQISFSATQRGLGRIRAVGEVGGSLIRLQSTYRLQRVLNSQGQDIFSNDGNLSLHLEPGSLPGNEAFLVVMPPGAIPGSLPVGLVLIGDAYDITASGALLTLKEPGVVKLRYDTVLVTAGAAPEGLGLYRWNPSSQVWQQVPAAVDDEQRAMIAPITTLGTYALLAPSGPRSGLSQNIFLPIIIKQAP